MLPLIQRQAHHGFGGDAIVENASRQTQAKLASFEIESPAHLTLVTVPGAGEDHAGFRGGIDPGRQAEFVFIIQVWAATGVNEALAIEAGRRAQAPIDEMGKPTLQARIDRRTELCTRDVSIQRVMYQ